MRQRESEQTPREGQERIARRWTAPFCRRSLTRLAAVLLLAAALLAAHGGAKPALATTPSVGPQPVGVFKLQSSGNFILNIWAYNVTQLAAFDFTIQYDPSVISFVQAAPGPFLTSTGRTIGLCLVYNQTSNSFRYGCNTYTGPTPPSGSGIIAYLTFSPPAPGSSPIDVQNVVLSNYLGVPYCGGSKPPCGQVDGKVSVYSCSALDFNTSGGIDVGDISEVATRWNSHRSGGYDPAYDIDADSDIDVSDIIAVARFWNATC